MGQAKEFLDKFYIDSQRLLHLYGRYAKQAGESSVTLMALYLLYESPDGISQKQISAELFLPKQTVQSMILVLEKRGLIDSRSSEKDGRSRIHFLTPKGQKHCDGIILHLRNIELACIGKLDKNALALMAQTTEKFFELFEVELAKIAGRESD